MRPGRSLRRANPLTIIVGVVLCVVIVVFVFSPSRDATTSKFRKASAASNPLSPPTSPFRKQNDKSGKRIPPPVVHYHMNNVTSTSDPVGNRETILILTPLARFYQEYWDNLLKLTYPHELITLGFIIPKNKEGNAATAALQEQITKTQKNGPEKKRFASIIIERQDFDPPLASQSEAERHKMENQKVRRAAMSRARNSLLFTTLGPSTSWVLWLDSDIVETPTTLIQDLASHDKAIIVPNCFQRYMDPKTKKMSERPYDFNSWQDSDTARKLGDTLGRDDILLEGYAEMATYRTLMAKMDTEDGGVEQEISLDGVGGTALLVKAEVYHYNDFFHPSIHPSLSPYPTYPLQPSNYLPSNPPSHLSTSQHHPTNPPRRNPIPGPQQRCHLQIQWTISTRLTQQPADRLQRAHDAQHRRPVLAQQIQADLAGVPADVRVADARHERYRRRLQRVRLRDGDIEKPAPRAVPRRPRQRGAGEDRAQCEEAAAGERGERHYVGGGGGGGEGLEFLGEALGWGAGGGRGGGGIFTRAGHW
ncbi:hypothetical protein B7494_g3327 [Chlorociboria aeruginascens]|nr:hypothetical protein B7494_g3327 [Chlorociboria aeruginascens]